MNIALSDVIKYPQVFELDFKIRSYEIDFKGYLNPVILCYMLQEIASAHASSVKEDILDLMEENKTWMLSRLKLKINRYPKWKDEIRVFTWPVGIHRLFAIRDFLICDSKGETLGVATSNWLVIDLGRRKPVRVDKYLNRMYLLPDIRSINQFIEKANYSSLSFNKAGTDRVNLSDIDINGHMTSMKYIEKIVNDFDEGIRKENMLSEILIYFNSEALLYDNLSLEMAENSGNGSYFHRIIRDNDNKELCFAKTVWRKLH